MADAGTLVTKITADSTKFLNELTKAKSATEVFSQTLKTVGLAGVAAFGLVSVAIGKSIKDIGQLADAAENLNTSVATLQKLNFAAAKGGVSGEGLQKALSFFQTNLGKNTDDFANGLDRIGLSANKLAGLDIGDQFTQAATAFKNANLSIDEKSALSRLLFNKTGADLIGLLNSNLAETTRQAEKLGLVLSSVDASNIDKLDDNLGVVGKIFTGLSDQTTAALAPALNTIIDKFIELVDKMGGVKSAGEAIASGLLKSFKVITDALGLLATTFDEFKNATTGASREGFISKAFGGFIDANKRGINAVGSLYDTGVGTVSNLLSGDGGVETNPNVVGSTNKNVFDLTVKSELSEVGKIFADTSVKLESFNNNVGQVDIGLAAFSSAMKTSNEQVSSAMRSIAGRTVEAAATIKQAGTSLLASIQSGLGSSELGRIIGSNAENILGKPVQDSGFDSDARDLYSQILDGKKLSKMQLDQLSVTGNLATNESIVRGGSSNDLGFKGVVAELKKASDNITEKKEVKLSISLDQGLIAKVISTSGSISTNIQNILVQRINDEASATAARR